MLHPLRVDDLRIDTADTDHAGDDYDGGEQYLGTDRSAGAWLGGRYPMLLRWSPVVRPQQRISGASIFLTPHPTTTPRSFGLPVMSPAFTAGERLYVAPPIKSSKVGQSATNRGAPNAVRKLADDGVDRAWKRRARVSPQIPRHRCS
jgi:hypothetical protein